MYSVDIIAAFDFLSCEIKIGTLEYERLKGNASFRFAFEREFLARLPRVSLSADLGVFLGTQAGAGRLFSFLGDALPDRWGRALIDKKERLDAVEKNRVPRTFDDFDYLVRIDDATRMGGLRFKSNGKYLGTNNTPNNIPPIANLDTFIREARMIEEADKKGLPIQKTWIDNAIVPGSSLGGARPKLNVIDNEGDLWIAKIPSLNDVYDVGLWEHFACNLAKRAGIDVAESKVLRIGPTPYHTLLSKRFDRVNGKRVHFASSLTLSGLKDGDNASNGKGYVDIVDTMAGKAGMCSLKENIEELFRRVAFNILIGNHDDHFRNHGFLLRKDGWELSPAYDLNPTNQKNQVLSVTPYSNDSSLKNLLQASEYYLINKNKAEQIIQEVVIAVRNWRQVAKNSGIPQSEQERFSARFGWSLMEADSLFPDLESSKENREDPSKGYDPWN